MVKNIEIADNFEANMNIKSVDMSRLKILVLVVFLFLCFFAFLSGVSAKNFNSSSTNQEIQDFLSNTSAGDNEVVLDGGNYNQITGLSVSRSVNISSNGQVNIQGTNTGTLFTITAPNVRIVKLNISGYNIAINSNRGNISVIGCNISTIGRSVHLSGNSLTDVLLENNTIISSVSSTSYGAVYATATAGSVVKITVKGNNITGNGTSNSIGVRFHIPNSNNTLIFENNNITGTSYYGFYLTAYTNNNTITITNNNITGNSYCIFLDVTTNSSNTITITNNNITGTSSSCVYFNAFTSNNTITVTNNNITGISATAVSFSVYINSSNTITMTNNNIIGTSSVYLNAYTNSNNTITIINNNITGASTYCVLLNVNTNSSNTITITNNNIIDTIGRGVSLDAHTNNNNITITNNNITGTSFTGVYLNVYTSNNTITITNNNIITGIPAAGVYLAAYTSNNTISFINNNIRGTTCGLYINGNNASFSGLSVVNNTINATNSDGIGVGFINVNSTALSDILFTGNNIFGGITGGTGINFDGFVSLGNVTFNYNRVLAATGLSISTTTSGSVDANFNWWGVNAPVISGMTLVNWFVMQLSANSFWTINNATVNQSGLVNLTYKFLLYTNATNSTSVVGFANLPNFLVDMYWNSTSGIIHSVSGVDALKDYTYSVVGGVYTLNVMGDWSDVMLIANVDKLNSSSTIVVPGDVKVGKTIDITGVLTDNNGDPIANIGFNVIVDGKTYTVTTDKNGRWVLSYKPTHTGNVDISVSFTGNDIYNSFTNNTNFNVKKGNIHVEITVTENPDGSVTIIANATDEDGDPVADYPVDFILDGKTMGHGTTDENGIATITIPSNKISDGPHTVTVVVIGGVNFNDGLTSTEFTKTDNSNDTINKTSNNPAPANAVAMKKTGIPMNLILLALLSVFGLVINRRKLK
jgi:hypothetical protein